MIVTIVPREGLPLVWATVAPILDKALHTIPIERATILELYDLLLKDQMTLWAGYDEETKEIVAAACTHIIVYPHYKAVGIPFIAGARMREWLPVALDLIKRYARDVGCKTIEGYGREAWIDVIRRVSGDDWHKAYTVFEFEVPTKETSTMAAE